MHTEMSTPYMEDHESYAPAAEDLCQPMSDTKVVTVMAKELHLWSGSVKRMGDLARNMAPR